MRGVQVGFIQMSLIEMSLTAGIMIIGIVLFRSLFVHRVPKRIMMILWGMVVLRLLLPFCLSLPVPGIRILMPEHVQPAEYTFGEATVSIANLGTESTDMTLYMVDMPAKINWGMILKIVYLTGAAVMTAGSVYLYGKDGKLLRESLPMEQEQKERLIKLTGAGQKEQSRLEKIDFRISDRTATPITYGVLRPAIVFPKGIFFKEEKEVGFCLLHELIHIRNHDNLLKVIVHAALCIHWFNPLVWVMYSLFNRDIELLCDETAVRRCKTQRQDYALALLSLAERRRVGFRTALGFGKNAVKERILAVMTARKPTIGGGVAAALAMMLALTAFWGSRASAVGIVAAEYTITADENTAFVYEDEGADYTAVVMEEAEPYITVNFMSEAEADKVETASAVPEHTEAVTAMEEGQLSDTLIISLQNLAEEFAVYGLQVEITPDDYQLYFDGEPVYFLVDNRSQEEDSFSGSVYAREAGEKNGNTGVATKRDESGVIVGLVGLSKEESEDIAKAWTGKR